MTFSPEQHPRDSGRLGLSWATIVRLPHPGPQYVVAPILADGTCDMAHGVRDIWRDAGDADDVADRMEAIFPEYEWHVWSRTITPFEIDD